MSKRIPPEIRNKIVAMYTTPNADGTWTGSKTIARELGLYQATVYNILKTSGVNTRDRKQCHANGKVCKPVKNIPVGDAPFCKCGCGATVAWNQRKNRWKVYVPGHYRNNALYKSAEWLRIEYEVKHRTMNDIAEEHNVHTSTIRKFLGRFGIRARTQKESIVLSGGVRGSRNPSWKGGIAKWDYAHNWKRIARIVRKRDNYTCQICLAVFPKSSKLLHVHHIDGDKFNNSPDNLVTVCATCHPKGKRKERNYAAQSTN